LDLLLQKTGAVRLLSPIPFAAPLAWLFFARWGAPAALAWACLFAVASVACYLRRRRLEARRPITGDDIAPVLRGRTRDILLLGAFWGLGPWMLDPHGELAYLLLTSIFVVAAIALGAMIVATHRQTIAAFAVPAGLGMITACAWFGGVVGWVLAACTAGFLAMALDWISQQADLLEQSLVVRFEKEDLARRLEDAGREKTRFFASASHDLRQPLHAISLFTSALEHAVLAPPEAQKVAQLSRSVHALGHSLDAMLDVSRLDAGAVQPVVAAAGVHALFTSLQNTFAGRAEAKGLQLRFRAPGELAVRSDTLLLERLLANLVDNALKYTQAGGVLVAARDGAVSGRAGWVRFDVVDTGIGIAPEHQQAVFDEFYQLGNPQRDRRFGLGIGLSIVRRLSGLLGHPVALRSRPGRGSRFQAWVPQAEAKAVLAVDALQRAALPEAHRLPRHVLVVDDEAASREATAALLASHGCRVSAAGDLAHAARLVESQGVDAVVADYRLPGESSGLDFLLALRAAAPRLRLLLVTGETAPQRIATIQASGMPCLFKPVQAALLLQALVE
ncbi:MAG: response regulator, partial [Comamonadaceae bacterium]